MWEINMLSLLLDSHNMGLKIQIRSYHLLYSQLLPNQQSNHLTSLFGSEVIQIITIMSQRCDSRCKGKSRGWNLSLIDVLLEYSNCSLLNAKDSTVGEFPMGTFIIFVVIVAWWLLTHIFPMIFSTIVLWLVCLQWWHHGDKLSIMGC